MASNDDHNTSDNNNNPVNESSYHIKLVSFEDSQIDHFIPYSSPSILYWQTNKKSGRNFYSDVTDIEAKRGNSSNSDLTTSKIEQIPSEDTHEFQTEKKKIEINQTNSDQRINLLNTSKIAPLSSKSDLASLEISNLTHKPELNKSITLTSLETNVQKKLQFLDISERETAKSDLTSHDNTGEILLELSCETEMDQAEENSEPTLCQSTFDSELNYYKLIDIKLDEMRQKKIELLKKDNTKSKNAPIAWEISASPNVSEKENSSVSKSCEMSTQTSFVEVKQRKKILNESNKSPLSQLRFDMVQQKKFKTMIEAQKHEKRYKELELLAKIERLQAQRLKKLIMENTTDETTLIDNSYFHSTNLNDNSVDSTKLGNFVKKFEDKDRRKSELVRSTFSKNIEDWSLISECDSVLSNSNSMRLSLNSKKSQVEVVNLNKIQDRPKGIKIVKENEIRKVSSDSQQIKPNFNKREYFSDLSNKIKMVQSEPILKKKDDNLSSFSAMSLQDAFLIFKKDLIERSNKRLRNIEERAQMRRLQAEYDRKQAQMNLKLKEVEKKFQVKCKPKVEIPRKRAMSSQEIRFLTKKNYEKLPEVKQKQQKERLEQNKKLNLIKSSIYRKTIQQHVLTKGPNFGLNFKALKN